MLDRVSTVVLGLDGRGDAERFADYLQWDSWLGSQQANISADRAANTARKGRSTSPLDKNRPGAATKKLSHNEGREFASIERRIAKAEEDLLAKRAALEDPEISSDAPRLHTAYLEMESAQKTVDELYSRWAELGQRTPEQLEK
jgi:ABC transport system ATP-binding/permease protein